jgi:elongation factor P hydroxylase
VLSNQLKSDAMPDVLHEAHAVEALFNQVFYTGYQTYLVGGASEPLYKPASNEQENNYIYYREDFFASALHEVAHWCIAGVKRRQQIDFGYWYVDDGRDATEQKAFEAAEVKPQALELLFSLAAKYPFQVSADNLNGSAQAIDDFKQAVFDQAQYYANNGLPKRATLFYSTLSMHFKGLAISELGTYFQYKQKIN